MVINDHFSKYIRLYPLRDRLAETAAKYLADYCMDFGIPGKLLSDQDPAYESKLFQELMRILEIKKLRTSGYRPQTNGLTEQSNSTVKKYLTIYLTEGKIEREWDLMLKPLSYAYNSSTHTSTKYTPAELMFGRRFKIPSEMLYGNLECNKFYSLKDFQKNIRIMYECAKRAMDSNQQTVKKFYDKRRKEDDLHVGDYVYVYNPRTNNMKLKAKWEGPHKVVAKSENVYLVEMLQKNKPERKWLPRDRLRRCYEHYSPPQTCSDIGDEPPVIEEESYITSSSSEDEIDDAIDLEEEPGIDEPEGGASERRRTLRERPTPAPDRFTSSQINFL